MPEVFINGGVERKDKTHQERAAVPYEHDGGLTVKVLSDPACLYISDSFHFLDEWNLPRKKFDDFDAREYFVERIESLIFLAQLTVL